jgi:hypothetical protein
MGLLFYSKGGVRSKILEWKVIDIFYLVRVIKFIFIKLGLKIKGPSY